jgi:glyoxylase-like metal-dependent hydrolase (beta-lactamase superfamily II)
MGLKKITNRVYYLPSEELTDRPTLGYIKGDKYSLAIDAGNSLDHVEKFYKVLETSGLRLPEFTIITHWHWDHTFGMHAVSGKTIACRRTNEKLGEVRKWKWTDEAMEKRLLTGEDIEICNQCIKLEYPDRNTIIVIKAEVEFTGGLNIDLGGVHCEIKEFNGPHSEDSVLVYIPAERVAFIGDADNGDYYQNDGQFDKSKLKKMINVLDKIDVDMFVSGHGAPESKSDVLDFLKEELVKEE